MIKRDRAIGVVLVALAVLGFAYDAYAHLDLASLYDLNRTSTLSQGDLFRFEGVVAILAAVAIVLRPRRWTALIALAVAASALAAVLVYRYYMVGKIGPIPNMYEPIWYAEKTRSAYAEGLATLASAGLLARLHLHRARA